jgi:hypothetical protein
MISPPNETLLRMNSSHPLSKYTWHHHMASGLLHDCARDIKIYNYLMELGDTDPALRRVNKEYRAMIYWYDVVLLQSIAIPITILNMKYKFLVIGSSWKQNLIWLRNMVIIAILWTGLIYLLGLNDFFVFERSMRQVKHFFLGNAIGSTIMTCFWIHYRNTLHQN